LVAIESDHVSDVYGKRGLQGLADDGYAVSPKPTTSSPKTTTEEDSPQVDFQQHQIPSFEGKRTFKLKKAAVTAITVIMAEQGYKLEFSRAGIETKSGFFIFGGPKSICPLHKRNHHSNRWCLFQPRDPWSNGSFECFNRRPKLRQTLRIPISVLQQ
jgi:hypothetical protein